jgi:iron complex transport system ATP-binding protein
MTVLWVLHDLNQAAQFSDRVVLLGEGRLLADGPPGQALQPDLIDQAFALRVVRVPHPETGQLLCVPSVEQANAVASSAPRSVA